MHAINDTGNKNSIPRLQNSTPNTTPEADTSSLKIATELKQTTTSFISPDKATLKAVMTTRVFYHPSVLRTSRMGSCRPWPCVCGGRRIKHKFI